jgi:DNA replication and repair protein RecF
MVLKKIKYQGFRNLVDAELEFSDDFNFIIGKNGAGKTNLLEAIFYAGLGSSFRVREEENMIQIGESFLRVDAETEQVSAGVFYDGHKKKLTLRGNEVRRLSNYVGWLGLVILSIEDIWMVRGGPSRRRSFIDWTIAKISAVYLSNLIEYRKILRQRNSVLQNGDEPDDEVLQLFNEQLIKTGNEIYRERAAFLPKLKDNIMVFGDELGLHELTLGYRSTCPDMHLDDRILERIRSRELIVGHTLVGPHRDDLVFSIHDRPLRDYASEGEERAGVVSMKLSEAEILYKETGERPVLILDEVSAELDRDKTKILLGLLKGQIFYASTQLPDFSQTGIMKNSYFAVDRGRIEVSQEN